jgi:hypothetical protein
MDLGTNTRSKFLSDNFAKWRNWPACGETLYCSVDIFGIFDNMVDDIPLLQISLCFVSSICGTFFKHPSQSQEYENVTMI